MRARIMWSIFLWRLLLSDRFWGLPKQRHFMFLNYDFIRSTPFALLEFHFLRSGAAAYIALIYGQRIT